MNAPLQTPDALLDTLWKQLHHNMEAFERGEVVDTSRMEDLTRELCEAITSLPQQEAKNYASKLEELIVNMNEAAEKMTRFQNDVKEEISEINQRQKALNAYGQGRESGTRRRIKKKPSE